MESRSAFRAVFMKLAVIYRFITQSTEWIQYNPYSSQLMSMRFQPIMVYIISANV